MQRFISDNDDDDDDNDDDSTINESDSFKKKCSSIFW